MNNYLQSRELGHRDLAIIKRNRKIRKVIEFTVALIAWGGIVIFVAIAAIVAFAWILSVFNFIDAWIT